MSGAIHLQRIALLVLAALVLHTTVAASTLARLLAPKAEPWPRWEVHNPAAGAVVDHSAWNDFLEHYLVIADDGVNRLAYAAVSSDDRRRLDAYIDGLATARISDFARDEQRAFWINLYNALTVRVVLDHYPVDSIRDIDISPGLFADGPWDKALLTIEGEPVTLNDIEHRILRPIWNDPRIHYAVNCASLGCPNLRVKAYTGENAERLLEAAARAYVNHPRGVRVGKAGLRLSSIYNWFRDDFDRDGGVLEHLRRYAAPDLQRALAGQPAIAGYDYDWSLNATPNRAR